LAFSNFRWYTCAQSAPLHSVGHLSFGVRHYLCIPSEEFFIAFAGSAKQFALLSKFFSRLSGEKARLAEAEMVTEHVEQIVQDPTWIDLLDADAIDRLSRDNAWSLEDVLECILLGEYALISVSHDGSTGRLIYSPWSFPFGGTDSLKALVQTFGMQVTRDSFHDGFTEWQGQNG
jgi:hypothetical protein